jgi:AraC-like DNA-binding protein
MSFRDKRAEVQLGRARELLATSKSKIVEVALESGYKSLSLFNLMFTRRFGTSPGRWREKYRNNGNHGGRDSHRNDSARRFGVVPKQPASVRMGPL